jgi:hypothetical protein
MSRWAVKRKESRPFILHGVLLGAGSLVAQGIGGGYSGFVVEQLMPCLLKLQVYILVSYRR